MTWALDDPRFIALFGGYFAAVGLLVYALTRDIEAVLVMIFGPLVAAALAVWMLSVLR